MMGFFFGDFHNFSVAFAERHGLEEAILFRLIQCEIDNDTLNTKFHKDTFWAELSIEDINRLCPYMKPQRIALALTKMKDKGLIEIEEATTEYKEPMFLMKPTEVGKNACITNM